MPIAEAQLLQWIGISTAGRRNILIDDFMPAPEGLMLMKDVRENDLKDANSLYAKRDNNPFTLGRIHLKRILSLALWVKDMIRIDREPEFPDDVERDRFLNEIEMAYEREERRQELKKVGEALLGKSFQTQLKGQSQWKRWSLELKSTLNSIVGVNGVPISYVIRANREPEPNVRYSTWEEMAVAMAPVSGANFKQDARTVHQIILANIHEDSDAYTYVKADLPRENGRKDIQNLRDRYESHATQQTLINEAKQVLATLRYKHPRAMRFETFSAKLQRALDDLEECGRPEDNGNVVDDLWDRIQDPNLQSFKAALKVQYSLQPRSYKDILTDLAAEVASKSKSNFGGNALVSAVGTTHNGTTSQGSPPEGSAITADGKLYIGNYTSSAWKSEDVRPYHSDIREARSRNPSWKSGKNSYSSGKSKPYSRKDTRKVKAIKKKDKEIAALKAKVASLESSPQGKDDGSTESTVKTSNAGNSFGGKASMSKKD